MTSYQARLAGRLLIKPEGFAAEGLSPTPLPRMDFSIPEAGDTDYFTVRSSRERTIEPADAEAEPRD